MTIPKLKSYWRPLKRSLTVNEVSFIKYHFPDLVLKFDMERPVYKFKSNHTHTIYVLPEMNYRVIASKDIIDADGGPVFILICASERGDLVQFEATRGDGEKLLMDVKRFVEPRIP